MTQMLDTSTPDFHMIKQRQQQTWASGDFSVVAARIVLVAEHLVDAADLQAGWRVLDVATGSGNAAISAARLGCQVVGVDYVPALPSGAASAQPPKGPTTRRRPRSSSASFALAGRSRSRAGLPTASSATSSGRRRSTYRRLRAFSPRCSGEPSPTCASCSGTT